MSAQVSQRDFLALLKRLSQEDGRNLRVGSTPPFPSLDDFEKLKKLGNCSVRFSKVYQLPRFLKDAGASGGKIYLLEPVGERKRLEHLKDVVNRLPLMVKKSGLGLDSDEENFMDVIIGARLNLLVAARIAPGFMRTVDWFVCHDFFENKKETVLYSIIERQDVGIEQYLLGGPANLALNRSLLAQLLYNIEAAQDSLGWVHYDLHAGNVFVRVARDNEQLIADFWGFKRSNGRKLWISADDTNRHEPVIIDFGRNRIQSPLFTRTGRLRRGRAAGTEVLVLEGFENVGINENLHRQWDMRRFSTHLVEALLEEEEKETRKKRTTTMRGRSGRSMNSGPPKDYFQRLYIQSQRDEYTEFMNVLDEMSGHRHVKLRSELKDKKLIDIWDFHYEDLRDDYKEKGKKPRITQELVEKALRKFRKNGVRQIAKWTRAGKEYKLDIVTYMWSWTEFTFDSTPSEVLEMPFFKKLYVKPRFGMSWLEVAEFRELVDVAEGITVGCAATDCTNIAVTGCACETIGYCSDSCADTDWTEHQHTCTH